VLVLDDDRPAFQSLLHAALRFSSQLMLLTTGMSGPL